MLLLFLVPGGQNQQFSFSCFAYIDSVLNNSSPSQVQKFENFKSSLETLDSAGIDVILLLAYGSKENYKNIWEITGCTTNSPEDNCDIQLSGDDCRLTGFPPLDGVWRDYVKGMMENVGEYISGVEVWNEQNHFQHMFRGSVGDYITLFRIAAEEVKLWTQTGLT